jgi:hypothetical protein
VVPRDRVVRLETLVGIAQGYEQIALYRNVVEEVLRESVEKTASTFDEV